MITKYPNKISGPLLDRIDIHVEVPAVKYKVMAGGGTGEHSEEIRAIQRDSSATPTTASRRRRLKSSVRSTRNASSC
jgi:predicted ATPase with chaperone activity